MIDRGTVNRIRRDGANIERDRIRKLALEPSKEMVERLAPALIRSVCGHERERVEDWAPHVRAVLRAFAEEIGR